MSRAQRSRRGQPLAVYGLILLGWVGLRTVWWESPFPHPAGASQTSPVALSDPESATEAGAAQAEAQFSPPGGTTQWHVAPPLMPVQPAPLQPMAGDAEPSAPFGDSEFDDRTVAAGHQLIWLAAMAQLPVPRGIAEAQGSRSSTPPQAAPWHMTPAARQARRWSLDSWIYVREGSGSALRGSGPQPSYGASQEGAVLRYRLAKAGGHKLDAYARLTHALTSPRDTEFSAGLSAKPLTALPLRLHAEMRAARFSGETVVRPSAFVTTGLHEEMPHGVQLRGYGQAGYVGGKYATAFADGQLVADRQVAKFDLAKTMPAKLRLGAGVWGGAQKGAERLDVGPSANVTVPVADAPVRLSVDYRVRVAGEAEPGSGVAVTLSTGF